MTATTVSSASGAIQTKSPESNINGSRRFSKYRTSTSAKAPTSASHIGNMVSFVIAGF